MKLLHYAQLMNQGPELYAVAVIVDRSGNTRLSLLGGPGFMPRHREGYSILVRALNEGSKARHNADSSSRRAHARQGDREGVSPA